MVKRHKAALIICKPDVRAYILHLNQKKAPADKFILDYKKGSKPQKLNRYYDDIPDTKRNRNFQLIKLIELLKKRQDIYFLVKVVW